MYRSPQAHAMNAAGHTEGVGFAFLGPDAQRVECGQSDRQSSMSYQTNLGQILVRLGVGEACEQ